MAPESTDTRLSANPTARHSTKTSDRFINRFSFLLKLRLQDLQESLGEPLVFENRVEQHQTTARIGMLRQSQERGTNARIIAETLGAADQPQIELVFEGSHIGGEFGLKAFGIVDQIAGVHVEE